MTFLRKLKLGMIIYVDNDVLCGIAKYIPPNFKIGHYVAICRSIQNNWSEKNDLVKYKKSISKGSLSTIKISGIFYAKYIK